MLQQQYMQQQSVLDQVQQQSVLDQVQQQSVLDQAQQSVLDQVQQRKLLEQQVQQRLSANLPMVSVRIADFVGNGNPNNSIPPPPLGPAVRILHKR